MKYYSSLENLSDPYDIAVQFYNILINELKVSSKLYGKEDSILLKWYYRHLLKDKSHFKYYTHYYALRIMHLIKNIKKGKKLLDAGCGFGSDAILSGILGGDVVGVDILPKWLNIAKKRLRYYKNTINKNLDVKFHLENIFNHKGEYEIIWLSEAISHINPVEKFLEISHNNLNIGGNLIIADSNKINPYKYLFSKKAQKKHGLYFPPVKDPRTGEKIVTGNELFFSIPNIKNILSKFFNLTEIHLLGYIPYFIFNKFDNFSKKIEEKFLRKLPIFNLISAVYVITGVKTKEKKKL